MTQQKILLLENVAAQAAGVRERLAQAGHQVAVSRFENDGLQRLAEWRPDLVLLSTAHPAGGLVEYCRQARALAPAARIVLTSSLNRERLLQEYPDLATLVDDVLLRPYSFEEVHELLAGWTGAAGRATEAGRAVPPASALDGEALRVEFQSRLEEKFLEVEEFKRRLEAVTKQGAQAAAREAESLRAENERLRVAAREAEKKCALISAKENLKRSELEVKLDNLLRMKDEFERVTQDELEARAQEAGQLRAQLEELRVGSGRTSAELETLRAEHERALVEKEQLEERLHALAAGKRGESTAALERVATLEAEVQRRRAQEAAAEVALADALAQEAVLEEALARERQGRVEEARRQAEERERQAAEAQTLRERVGAAERRCETLLAERDGLAQQARASEAARVSIAAEAEAAVAEIAPRVAQLEGQLARERESRLAAEQQAEELRRQIAPVEGQLARERESRAAAEQRVEELGRQIAPVEGQLARERETRLAAEQQAEELRRQIAPVEGQLARERETRLAAEQQAEELRRQCAAQERLAAEVAPLRQRLEDLGRELEQARIRGVLPATDAEGERLRGELVAVQRSLRETAAERDQFRAVLEERERRLTEEVRAWREKAESAALETGLLRAQGEERASRVEEERRLLAERIEQTGRALAERERESAAFRDESLRVAAAVREELAGIGSQLQQARAVADETRTRLESAEATLAAEREGTRTREEEFQRRLAAEQATVQTLQDRLAGSITRESGMAIVTEEIRQTRTLLEEVITRARDDAVNHERREAELARRLQSMIEAQRPLQERFDRVLAEAAERERRSAALLQSAIERGPAPVREAPVERANLPAVVPLETGPRVGRRTLVLAGSVAAAAIVVAISIAGLRRPAAPPQKPQAEPAPVPVRQIPEKPPGVASAPREIWERWTRSDGSGGVLVQATLRSEQELRAEFDAEQNSRGSGAAEANANAEFERRLAAFRFDDTYYFSVFFKNLVPGYPAYLDDILGRVRLRDSAGHEVVAFFPPGHEKERRVFTYGAGAPGELIYEAAIPLAFSRTGLDPATTYLQLVVSDVGGSSRRVFTWELE